MPHVTNPATLNPLLAARKAPTYEVDVTFNSRAEQAIVQIELPPRLG
jgi:hypothetical protein